MTNEERDWADEKALSRGEEMFRIPERLKETDKIWISKKQSVKIKADHKEDGINQFIVKERMK